MTHGSRKDVTVPAPYDIDAIAGPHDKETYLPQDITHALKRRPDNKPPHVPNFVAPQRQTSEQTSAPMKEAMFPYLDAIVASHSTILQTQKSILGGPVSAVGIKNFAAIPEAERPEVYRKTRGEMADQKNVVELGWGRRHRLSGGAVLPWNYTFVYAPRDGGEFGAWKGIVGCGGDLSCECETGWGEGE